MGRRPWWNPKPTKKQIKAALDVYAITKEDMERVRKFFPEKRPFVRNVSKVIDKKSS